MRVSESSFLFLSLSWQQVKRWAVSDHEDTCTRLTGAREWDHRTLGPTVLTVDRVDPMNSNPTRVGTQPAREPCRFHELESPPHPGDVYARRTDTGQAGGPADGPTGVTLIIHRGLRRQIMRCHGRIIMDSQEQLITHFPMPRIMATVFAVMCGVFASAC